MLTARPKAPHRRFKRLVVLSVVCRYRQSFDSACQTSEVRAFEPASPKAPQNQNRLGLTTQSVVDAPGFYALSKSGHIRIQSREPAHEPRSPRPRRSAISSTAASPNSEP